MVSGANHGVILRYPSDRGRAGAQDDKMILLKAPLVASLLGAPSKARRLFFMLLSW